MLTANAPANRSTRRLSAMAGIVLALIVFCAGFFLLDGAYYRFANARFPRVGSSTELANLWGVVSRLHLLVFLVPLVLWRPRQLGFQIGKIREHWRMVLIMLTVNCGVVGGYLLLTQSTTPYSGNQWLLTEVIIVPVVEETFWRGIVFAVLLVVLSRLFPAAASQHLTVWLSGLAFGALHAANATVGVPFAFVMLQTLSAAIWGVMYGYARARTESIYPPMLLHAATNLVVVLM
jgi:membrane protease YdiL (CAAX protease family)